MQVAMRQFGIALLIVHDDDGISNKWPYQTPNFLRECGSGVFLPLTFGLIHVPRDGNIDILRKRCPIQREKDEWEPCFVGYALGMKENIRTKNVNLLTGMFSLSYTSFADFLLTPKLPKNTGYRSRPLPRFRDYRDGTYWQLQDYRICWDEYQCYLQDHRRAKKAKKKEASHQEAPNDGNQKSQKESPNKHGTRESQKEPPHQHETRGASSRARQQQADQGMHQQEGTQQGTAGAEMQEERDVDAMHSIMSYFGATDEERKNNRNWYNDVYLKAFPSLPTTEDMEGKGLTIETSLKLLGVEMKSKADCEDFFNNSKRADLVKERKGWFRRNLGKHIHPDKFSQKVVNETMKKEMEHRFGAVRTAVEALEEWNEVALDKKKQQQADNESYKFNALCTWESELYVLSSKGVLFMDYLEYRQPK
jgi:hypothetical protein